MTVRPRFFGMSLLLAGLATSPGWGKAGNFAIGYQRGLGLSFFGDRQYSLELFGTAYGYGYEFSSRSRFNRFQVAAGIRPSRRLLRVKPIEARLGLSMSSGTEFSGRPLIPALWDLRFGLEPIVLARIAAVPRFRLGASWSFFSAMYSESYRYGTTTVRRSYAFPPDGPSLLGSMFVYWTF